MQSLREVKESAGAKAIKVAATKALDDRAPELKVSEPIKKPAKKRVLAKAE